FSVLNMIEWRESCSVGTNTFNGSNPLLAAGLCLKLLTNGVVNNTLSNLYFPDWKPAFIHVVDIFPIKLYFAMTFSKSTNHCDNRSGDESFILTASIDRKVTLESSTCRLRKRWVHCLPIGNNSGCSLSFCT